MRPAPLRCGTNPAAAPRCGGRPGFPARRIGRPASIAGGATGLRSAGQNASVMVAPASALEMSLSAKMAAGSQAIRGCATAVRRLRRGAPGGNLRNVERHRRPVERPCRPLHARRSRPRNANRHRSKCDHADFPRTTAHAGGRPLSVRARPYPQGHSASKNARSIEE